MRKKIGKANHRKFSIIPYFWRRQRLPDETDWIVLEANISHRGASRKPRLPRYVWPVRISAVFALAISIPIGLDWASEEIFFDNEEFVLRHLNVETDGVLSEGKLLEVSNITPGMNLLKIDLAHLRVRLENLPIVKDVIIERELPDKINISVFEREPVAWLSSPPLGIRPGDMKRGFLLDKDGVFFRCAKLTNQEQTLPVIEVYRMEDPKEGMIMDSDGAESALELIAKGREVPGTENLLIQAVKLRNEWSIDCLYRSGLVVTFSIFNLHRGLEDLGIIVSQAREIGVPLATVNVAVAKNIPVTFSRPIGSAPDPALAKSWGKPSKSETESTRDMREKHLRSILNSG